MERNERALNSLAKVVLGIEKKKVFKKPAEQDEVGEKRIRKIGKHKSIEKTFIKIIGKSWQFFESVFKKIRKNSGIRSEVSIK